MNRPAEVDRRASVLLRFEWNGEGLYSSSGGKDKEKDYRYSRTTVSQTINRVGVAILGEEISAPRPDNAAVTPTPTTEPEPRPRRP